MTWADRLLRLATGDPQREVVEQLALMHRGALAQAQRFAADAAQAPNEASESELHALATERQALAVALDAALQRSGLEASLTAPGAPAANGASRNHWARLVAALEACRDERSQVLIALPRILELDASQENLFELVLRGLDAELLSLRALIARADPQALN